MKHALVLAALGVAPLANAQEWRFELSNPVLSPANPSTTVTLAADPGADWAFRGASLSVHATDVGWSDPTSPLPPPAQAPGVVSGGSVIGIAVHQHSEFGPWEPTPGVIDVWQATFTATDFALRTIDVGAETLRFEVYVAPWPSGSVESRLSELTEGAVAIRVVPALGTLAPMSLLGLAAVRRRRPMNACSSGFSPRWLHWW